MLDERVMTRAAKRTTSADVAWSLGRPEGQVTLEQCLDALRAISASVDLPVNADFEGGFAIEPHAVTANVALATATEIAIHRSPAEP